MILIERIQEAMAESYAATGREVDIVVTVDADLWAEAMAGTIGPIVRYSSMKTKGNSFTFQWTGGKATFKKAK